jgi:predicted MFS family arabinose efflux permease
MELETPVQLEEKATRRAATEKLTAGNYLGLLKANRNYRYLWFAQVVSLLGDWFSTVAVVTLVARYAGTAEALSGLFIFRLAPMILVGPFAGVLADRFNRRNLMMGADLARAVTALGFLLVSSASTLWLVYVLTLIQFSLGTLFDPARSALIPSLTSAEERVTANALGSMTWSSMVAIGASLGGLTSGLWGVQTAFVIDSLSFVGSALLVLNIPRQMALACGGKCGKIRLGADLKDGFAYLKNQPAILSYTLIKPLAYVGGGALFAVLALQAHNVYPLGQDGSLSLGLLNLAIGLGSGLGPWLGSLILRRIGETRANLQILVSVGFILGGLGYALFANTGALALAILLITLAELGYGSNWVYSTTLLQLGVAENFRGRVFAVELVLMNLVSVASALAGGFLLDRLGLSVGALGLGLGALQVGIGLTWLLISRRVARQRLVTEATV